MIEVHALSKRYGETEALRGVGFSIPRGQVVGLLGPNGAGKTTLMKIVVGYLLPTSGWARVAGHDVVEDPRAAQSRIGYLPENAPLYHDMLAQDYLDFIAEIRGLPAAEKRRGIERVVRDCAIQDVLTRPIGHLSRGYRQRVGLAAAMIHDPEILILDEPTSGLDPNQIVEVRALVRRMAHRKTVILSTHILSEVEASCDRAVILIQGRVRADGTLAELTRSRGQVVTVRAGDPARVETALRSVPGVSAVERSAGEDGCFSFRLALEGDLDVGEAVAAAVQAGGWSLRELRRDDRNLEQVFRELTASGATGPAGGTEDGAPGSQHAAHPGALRPAGPATAVAAPGGAGAGPTGEPGTTGPAGGPGDRSAPGAEAR